MHPVPHDCHDAVMVKAEDIATDLAPYRNNSHLVNTLGCSNASITRDSNASITRDSNASITRDSNASITRDSTPT